MQIETKTITLQHPTNNTTFKVELIQIEGGTFEMGDEELGEMLIRKVTVPTFWIGKYPVTQAFYTFVMGENPSHFKGKERPVEKVSWDDAQAFVQKLNRDFGGHGFRLPSEAEWEYAARGGKDWRKKFKYAGSDELDEVAWWNQNSYGETKPVGWKEPNQLGIYDMTGNVWEWVEDDWHSNYEDAPRDGRAWIDESRGRFRVRRGGSWVSIITDYCRVAYRPSNGPDYKNYGLGFRLGLP